VGVKNENLDLVPQVGKLENDFFWKNGTGATRGRGEDILGGENFNCRGRSWKKN